MNAHFQKDRIVLVAGIAALALSGVLGLASLAPPAPVAAGAPPEVFASGRAMADVRALSAEPRPLGSAGHERARAHVVERLRALGLEPEVQGTLSGVRTRLGYVHNVLARLRGTGGGKALLLCAHYDSVPNSFGAGDDAAAVAVLLETARALKAGPPLRRDVIFLFSDGEETGLLGARAFVAEHPWAGDVGAVLNFDARGSGGPVLVFETGPGSGGLVAALASAPRPAASSLFPEVYRRLENETDFDAFRAKGLPGLNFAFVGGLRRYHSVLDDAASLDERSLQHAGSYAVALGRALGGSEGDGSAAPAGVYFTLPGAGLVRYPLAWNPVLLVLATVLLAGLLVRGVRRRRMRPWRVLAALAAVLATMALAGVVIGAVWTIVRTLHGELRRAPWGQPDNAGRYALAFVVLAAGIVWLTSSLLRRRLDGRELAMAGLLLLLVGLGLTTFTLPGAAYLFAWPLLGGVLGFALFLADAPEERRGRGLVATAVFAGAPALLLLAPMAALLLTGLPVAFAPTVVALVVAPVLWLILPAFTSALGARRWAWPAVSVTPCLWLVAIGGVGTEVDGRQASVDSLFYGLDADSGEAFWMSTDRAPDAWTARYLSEKPRREPAPRFFPNSDDDVLVTSAPRAELAPPEVTWTKDEQRDGLRTVRLHVRSPRGAPELAFYVEGPTEVLEVQVEVDGRRWASPTDAARRGRGWWLRCLAVADRGLDLTLQTRGSGPLRLRVIDGSFGLPKGGEGTVPSRPDGVIPRPYGTGISDLTMVSRSFVREPEAASGSAAAARP
jgi:peptidase M28-like protein